MTDVKILEEVCDWLDDWITNTIGHENDFSTSFTVTSYCVSAIEIGDILVFCSESLTPDEWEGDAESLFRHCQDVFRAYAKSLMPFATEPQHDRL